MSNPSLFIALATASTAEAVFEALDQYMPGHKTRHVGDIANNRLAVEVSSTPLAAVIERIMNGYDATIDMWQRSGRFTEKVKTPTLALEALADDCFGSRTFRATYAPVHLFMSVPGDMNKSKTNITICDRGTGQAREQFSKTYLSVGGDNKIANILMAGSYGQGGHSIYRYTEATLIYCRDYRNPNQISFTVVKRDLQPGWRAESYVYIVDDEGQVPFVDLADLSSTMLIEPSKIHFTELDHKDNEAPRRFTQLLENTILLPKKHGTVVRAFEISGMSDKMGVYNGFREGLFGIRAPFRFIHGPSTVPHSATYFMAGLRQTLNHPGRVDFASNRRINRALFIEPPVTIMDGQATLSCYVLQDSLSKTGTLSAENSASPVFVTLNGQTHKRLPIRVLLRQAHLLQLEDHIVVEINCDSMEFSLRSKYFTSNREDVTSACQKEIKDAILKYLRSQDRLAEINEMFLKQLVTKDEQSPDARKNTERFAEIMGTRWAGDVFSKWGNPNGTRTQVTGTVNGKGTGTHSGGKYKPPILSPIPSYLNIWTKTVYAGEIDEWITIRSDAMKDWENAFSINLPPFLKLVGQRAINDGRIGYNVTVSDDAPVGTTGDLEAIIDRGRANLEPLIAKSTITVVRRQRVEAKQVERLGLPEIQITFIGQDDPRWQEALKPVSDPDNTALRYQHENGKINLWLNIDFKPFRILIEMMSNRFGSEIGEQAKTDYEFAARSFVLSDMEFADETDDNPTKEDRRQHGAATTTMKTYVMMTLIQHENLAGAKRRTKIAA